ncbi:MAG: NeuD/PglB/VioB family sugar acetyltransferase [Bacillota bacterium]
MRGICFGRAGRRRELLIVGAGGHGKVVADIAVAAGFKVIGFVDDGPEKQPPLPRYRILGTIGDLPAILGKHPHLGLVLAVGDNSVRRDLAGRIAGAVYPTVVHPSAVVSPHATLGPGTVVMPQVVVNAGTIIGAHVILNTSCSVDHDCRVGDFAHLAPGVRLAGGVAVGVGACLGTGASVVPQVKIGEWAVVGAGAAVVEEIPPRVVAVGVPARVVRRLG